MNFHIITLFPEMFDSYMKESIIGRAIKEKKINITYSNPRMFVSGKYKKVWPDGNISRQIDDRPFAGGPGMVMMADPIIKAVESIEAKILKRILGSGRAISKDKKSKSEEIRGLQNSLRDQSIKTHKPKILIINFVPSAEKFTTPIAKTISKKYTDVILICGRYEGIDSRLDKILKTKQYSIGDYVLTGGELPAMVLIDCISRQVSGVLGNFDSREEERISSHEVYTRPEVLVHKNKKYKVPSVLLSGDHKKIEEWKESHKK